MTNKSFTACSALRCFLVAVSLFFLLAPSIQAAPKTPVPLAVISVASKRASKSTFELPTKFKSISANDTLTITVGTYEFNLAGSEFKSKAKVASYTATKSALGISSLSFDTKKKTIKFSVQGVTLSQDSYPLPVTIKLNTAASCTLLASKKGTASKKSLRLFKAGSCPIAGERLSSSLGSVALKSETKIRFSLTLLQPATALSVYASDAGGFASKKICDLKLSGSSYSCDTTISASTQTPIRFIAKGKRGSAVSFPGVTIGVIGDLNDSVLATADSTSKTAIAVWESVKAILGNTSAAKLELIQQLLAMPGVVSASLSPNGIDVQYALASGLEVLLILNRDETQIRSARSASRSRSSEEVSSIIKARASAAPLKLFLYDPGYFPNTENETLRGLVKAAAPGKVILTDIVPAAASNLSVFDTLTSNDFVLFDTHGSVDKHGRIGFLAPFVTGTEYTTYKELFKSGKIMFSAAANVGPGISHSGVLLMPSFFESLPGQFNGSTVIGSSCYSLANSSLADSFISKGAAGFFGFDNVVSSSFASKIAGEYMCSGLVESRTNLESFNSFSIKVDPSPVGKSNGVAVAANLKYLGNPIAKVTSEAIFDEFKMKFEPEVLLLFYGETDSQSVQTNDVSSLPPCLVYKLTNRSSQLVTASRDASDGSTKEVGAESFSESSLNYTALNQKGLADLTLNIEGRTSDSVVGKADPKVEVLCKKPLPGLWKKDDPVVYKGTPFTMSPLGINAYDCDFRFLVLVTPEKADGTASSDTNCGTPINAAFTGSSAYKAWEIKSSQLPLRLDTSACSNTVKIRYSFYSSVSSNIFDPAQYKLEVDSQTVNVVLQQPPAQDYHLESFFGADYYDYGPAYFNARVGMRWKRSDFPGVDTFCVAVQTNGQNNTIAPTFPKYPAERAISVIAASGPLPEADMTAAIYQAGQYYYMSMGGTSSPSTQRLNYESLYNNATNWTFTVRERPASGICQ